jgi:hypothetical protein
VSFDTRVGSEIGLAFSTLLGATDAGDFGTLGSFLDADFFHTAELTRIGVEGAIDPAIISASGVDYAPLLVIVPTPGTAGLLALAGLAAARRRR